MSTAPASFVHLHSHSCFSVGDSLATPEDLVDVASSNGQVALGLTDHAELAGAWRFARAARAVGLKPIIGMEVNIAFGPPTRQVYGPAGAAYGDGLTSNPSGEPAARWSHLVLLATSPQAWEPLCRLYEVGHANAWGSPRVTWDDLERYSTGLTCLTGCLAGPVSKALAMGDVPGARDNLARLVDIYGKANVYTEITWHGHDTEAAVNAGLAALAADLGCGLVATNDAHSARVTGVGWRDLWALSHQKATDGRGCTLITNGYGMPSHLASSAEMAARFANLPGGQKALATSVAIAESVPDDIWPDSALELPKVDGAGIAQAVAEGARARYGPKVPQEVEVALAKELTAFEASGMTGYLGVVADFVTWARSEKVALGPGRGSVCASVAAYCLGITQVDPLASGLRFDRFLSPGRSGLPDIDIDVGAQARPRCARYLAERWGPDAVAALGMSPALGPVAALARAGEALGAPDAAEALAAKLAGRASGSASIAEAMGSAAWKGLLADRETQAVADGALAFDGALTSPSTHPCGIVVSSTALVGRVPLRPDRRPGYEAMRVTAWDAEAMAELGLAKFDILSMPTLDILSEVAEMVGANPDDIAQDQSSERASAAWALIGRGATAGVFQLEGTEVANLCKQVKPACLDDLAVVIALWRPGPIHAGAPRRYLAGPKSTGIEAADAVLAPTRGTLVFQEQVMDLAEAVGGFDARQVHKLLGALSTRDNSALAKARTAFLAGGARRGESAEACSGLWDQICFQGAYSFAKAHAVGYALLAYQSAYVKANWPGETTVAMLAGARSSARRAELVARLVAEGQAIIGPDIATSSLRARHELDGTVRLGLADVKGVGNAAGPLVAERDAHGPYKSLSEILTRVPSVPVEVLTGLVEAGATDALGPRLGQVMVLRDLRKAPWLPTPRAEWSTSERLARCLARTGLVGDGDISVLLAHAKTWRLPWTASLITTPDSEAVGRVVTVIGALAGVDDHGTWAEMTLLGDAGPLCVVLAKAAYRNLVAKSPMVSAGQVIAVRARLVANEGRDDAGGLVCMALEVYSEPAPPAAPQGPVPRVSTTTGPVAGGPRDLVLGPGENVKDFHARAAKSLWELARDHSLSDLLAVLGDA